MSVKQISKITLKEGNKADLPDSLDEAELCFTSDTGEIFIGAPNFGPVQYRSSSYTGNDGQGISPYRNIKMLTEFDVTQTVTGDYFTQGPLVNTVVPISNVPSSVYTFNSGINSIVASIRLYDGVNVNMVADLYIASGGGSATVCPVGMISQGVDFSAIMDNNSIVLQTTNTSESIYTLYISAKCWSSSSATWSGAKGQGFLPSCDNGFTPPLA